MKFMLNVKSDNVNGFLFLLSLLFFEFSAPLSYISPFSALFLLIMEVSSLILRGGVTINRNCFVFLLVGFFYFIINSVLNFSIVASSDGNIKSFVIYTAAIGLYVFRDPEAAFRNYILFMAILIIVAIVQFIGYQFNISYLYDYRIYGLEVRIEPEGWMFRVNSFLREPAHLAFAIVPMVCILFIKKLNGIGATKIEWLSVVVIILTFSLNGYVGFFIILIFYFMKWKSVNKYIYIPIILIVFSFFVNNPFIESRLEALSNVGSTENISVLAFLSNMKVMLSVLYDSPLLGHGFWSHKISYDQYIYDYYSAGRPFIGLNRDDGASMFIKVISEFGVIGVMYFILYIFLYKGNEVSDIFIVSMLIYCLRNGGYINPYFIFFMFMILVGDKIKIESIIAKKVHKFI